MIPPIPTDAPIALRRVPRRLGLNRILPRQVEAADSNVRAEQKASANPFDVDELAMAMARIKGLGLWAARTVMGGGAIMAGVAAHEAVESIEDDLALWDRTDEALGALAPAKASGDIDQTATNMEARRAIIADRATWPSKAMALLTNTALFIGASGMLINLLCAELMLGSLLPALAPLAAGSFVVAVWGMAVWGGALCIQSIRSTLKARAIARANPPATQEVSSAAEQASAILRERAQKTPGRDAVVFLAAFGLGASALALQYLAAPITLYTLAASTFGLVAARVRRDALKDSPVGRWREQAHDLSQSVAGLEKNLVRAHRQHAACTHLRGTRFSTLPFGIGKVLVAPIANLIKRWSVEPWERHELKAQRTHGLALVHRFFGTPISRAERTSQNAAENCRSDLNALCAALYEIDLMPDFAQAVAADDRLLERPARAPTWYRGGREARGGIDRGLLPATDTFLFDTQTYLDAVFALPPSDMERVTELLFGHGVKALENRGANVTSERMAYVSEILLQRRAA